MRIRRSKTDPEAAGQTIAIAHGERAASDPIAALACWLELRGRRPGPLFTRTYGLNAHPDRLTGNTVTRMIHDRAVAAGLPAERITAHSLRAGHATTAALAGVPLERIAAQTRHRDLNTLVQRYIRPSTPSPTPPASISASDIWLASRSHPSARDNTSHRADKISLWRWLLSTGPRGARRRSPAFVAWSPCARWRPRE